MLELDLAISPFSHLAARAAYKTTRFKTVNQKLVNKFRSRLIPSVHLEILKHLRVHNPHKGFGHAFESFVKRQFGMTSNRPDVETYHYYVDAVTHPNMPHKYLKRFGDTNVMAICHKMWDGELCFPILADALEDQDFPDLEYLNHLRMHPRFSKANFVLQFMLNKRIGWPRGMKTSFGGVNGPAVPASRFAGFGRTQMNHPIQSHIRDLMDQLREQDRQAILRVGDNEFELTNFTIQERPDDGVQSEEK